MSLLLTFGRNVFALQDFSLQGIIDVPLPKRNCAFDSPMLNGKPYVHLF